MLTTRLSKIGRWVSASARGNNETGKGFKLAEVAPFMAMGERIRTFPTKTVVYSTRTPNFNLCLVQHHDALNDFGNKLGIRLWTEIRR